MLSHGFANPDGWTRGWIPDLVFQVLKSADDLWNGWLMKTLNFQRAFSAARCIMSLVLFRAGIDIWSFKGSMQFRFRWPVHPSADKIAVEVGLTAFISRDFCTACVFETRRDGLKSPCTFQVTNCIDLRLKVVFCISFGNFVNLNPSRHWSVTTMSLNVLGSTEWTELIIAANLNTYNGWSAVRASCGSLKFQKGTVGLGAPSQLSYCLGGLSEAWAMTLLPADLSTMSYTDLKYFWNCPITKDSCSKSRLLLIADAVIIKQTCVTILSWTTQNY